MITIALSKGRLSEYAMTCMMKCGLQFDMESVDSRSLQFFDCSKKYRFLYVKPSDVPTYVEHGVADIGIVGYDTLLEEDKDICEMLDLKFANCKICIAGFANKKMSITSPHLKVATKYVNIAKKYFDSLNTDIEIIKLNGSVELGPVVGLSDIILDIVESGSTLKANGLQVLEEICDVSARLVVNKVSLKTKGDRIRPLIDKLCEVVHD